MSKISQIRRSCIPELHLRDIHMASSPRSHYSEDSFVSHEGSVRSSKESLTDVYDAAACPVCGACEAPNENDARTLRLENVRLRRENSLPSLSSAARIISLEEKLADSIRDSNRRLHEMEILHAQSSNEAIHSLENDLEVVTAQRDAALLQVSELTARLNVANERLKREALVRMASEVLSEVHEEPIESPRLFDERAGTPPPPSPSLLPLPMSLSPQLSPLHSTDVGNSPVSESSGSRGLSGSERVRRALRKSRDAVLLTLPRHDF